jgi:hypothetical protein
MAIHSLGDPVVLYASQVTCYVHIYLGWHKLLILLTHNKGELKSKWGKKKLFFIEEDLYAAQVIQWAIVKLVIVSLWNIFSAGH